jgi:Ser/Thr protein kinase RdoA (MazF antagonist)
MIADLRNVARQVLRDFRVQPTRLVHLASRHNDVFRVHAARGGTYLLRIQNELMSDAQANSQLLWLDALAKDSSVKVPKPVRMKRGEPYSQVLVNGSRRRAVLLHWMPGSTAKTRDAKAFAAAARMIAQLHLHSETFRPPRTFSCRRLDGECLFGSRYFLRRADARGRVSRPRLRVMTEVEAGVRGAMHRIGEAREHFGVIHADLNLGNIVFHRGEPSPIDFDEFARGWFLYDLAELIRTAITRENMATLKGQVIAAYREVRPLSDADVAHFDAFILATNVYYLNWAFAHARDESDLKWVDFCIDMMGWIVRGIRRRFA